MHRRLGHAHVLELRWRALGLGQGSRVAGEARACDFQEGSARDLQIFSPLAFKLQELDLLPLITERLYRIMVSEL